MENNNLAKAYKTYEYIKEKIIQNKKVIKLVEKDNIELQEMLDEIKEKK